MTVNGKRSLPEKVQAMKARKRMKLAEPDNIVPLNSSKVTKRQVVSLDKLQWKDVQLPDRMDDYEGFFGLEEIDGIEIIKDDQTGGYQYRSDGNNPQHDADVAQLQDPPTTFDVDNGFNEDWDGFDDMKAHKTQVNGKVSAKSQKKPTSILKEAKKTPTSILKKAQTPKNEKGTQTTVLSAFQALHDQDEQEETDVSAWKSLKLSPDIMAALGRLQFTKPTSIQTASIPEILKGQDVIGKASTGSGKTLAFGIPIIDRFLERSAQSPKDKGEQLYALVLSPTRELAHQIEKHLLALTADMSDNGPSIMCLTGGLALQKQQRQLKSANIIVATPGRLWELTEIEVGLSKSLKSIQFLVIDEADRLLSEGHFKEVEQILNVLDREDDDIDTSATAGADIDEAPTNKDRRIVSRQTLVFSATFDKSLHAKLLGKGRSGGDLLSNKDSMEHLMSKLNFQSTPQLIDVNPIKQLATGLREGLIECGAMEKDLYLYAILLHHSKSRVMVFTNSISAVRRIVPLLQNLEIPVLALHSGMPQKARLRSVERLGEASAQNKGAVLVATDVAARGLDIPNVQLIVHYNLPRAADMYVHRSGRTARAGNSGSSIIICSPEEANGVRKLIAKVHAQNAGAHGLSAGQAAKQGFYIRTMDPDRKIVARLKPRVTLAKKLADITIAKEKQHKEDDFLQAAAEELGVDYDSDEFQKQAPGRSGRGSGRKQKERQAQSTSRAEAVGIRAELRNLLKARINVGVSEKYITSGKVDIADLLAQQQEGRKNGEFLGNSSGFNLDDE